MEVTPEHHNKRSREEATAAASSDDASTTGYYEQETTTDPFSELSYDDVKVFDDAPAVAVSSRPLSKRIKREVNYKDDIEDDGEEPTIAFKRPPSSRQNKVDAAKESPTSADKEEEPADKEEEEVEKDKEEIEEDSNDDSDDNAMPLSANREKTHSNVADSRKETGTQKSPLANVDVVDLSGDGEEIDLSNSSDDEVVEVDAEASRNQKRQFPAAARKEFPIGFKVKKQFDGTWFEGKVVSLPFVAGNQRVWTIKYEDSDSEDLNCDEIMELAAANATSKPSARPPQKQKKKRRKDSNKRKKEDDDDGSAYTPEEEQEDEENKKPRAKKWAGYKANYNKYDEVLHDLVSLIAVTHEEAKAALEKMTPPYGINKAIQLIHQAKKDPNNYQQEYRGRFQPHFGMRVRKTFGGSQYHGSVKNHGEMCETDDGKMIMHWRVEWDDGDYEDMDFDELLQSRADRPTRPHPVRGRQLCFLELFSGCGIVSQEFATRKWRVRSIDTDPKSNATDKLDIMKMRFEDLDMIPDCIWASPPCFTYSLMAGGAHRCPRDGEFELSPAAHENNRYLARLFYILKWALKKHPHLIICIENPVGLLRKMPLMQKMVKELKLKETVVHYCAFGRDDMKPTHIWTNDFNLHATLGEYTCKNKCPYGQNGAVHPISARRHGNKFNSAAIPLPLAEEVAQHVDSVLYQRRIRCTEEASMTVAEIAEFNAAMSKKAPKRKDHTSTANDTGVSATENAETSAAAAGTTSVDTPNDSGADSESAISTDDNSAPAASDASVSNALPECSCS